MKIAIVTTTYKKLDGSTYQHLKRALESVKKQIHQDYKMFLIGDDYSDNNELIELSKIIDSNKIYVENLPIAIERTKYSGIDLWRNGGVNAMNIGIKVALKNGYDYICHLDHDDMFLEDHLQIISECIEKTGTNFITTKCGIYPDIETYQLYNNYRPIASRLYKVSTCVNHKYFGNILFRNMIEERGISYAADADLWNRINKLLTDKNEYGIFINKTTCKKFGGKVPIKSPNIVK